MPLSLASTSRPPATEASRRATWWKQIKLLNPDRTDGPAVSTQDDRRGPEVLTVDAADIHPGSRLLLSKAMVLGVHTDVYEIGDLATMIGKNVDLQWWRDDMVSDPYFDGRPAWRAGYRFAEDHWALRPRDFNQILCDGDRIRVHTEDLGPGRERDVELVLATDGGVTWWKALRLFSAFDDFVTEGIVEGAFRSSPPISGRFEELWWTNLVFAKAKFLGKHEDKYEYQLGPHNLSAIGAAPGRRVVFTWFVDNLPRPSDCE